MTIFCSRVQMMMMISRITAMADARPTFWSVCAILSICTM